MSGVTAVFGGSFDPPHVGHVLAVAYVLATGEVNRVLVVPCFQHPLSKPLSSFDHRLAMCALAFRDLCRVEVSSVERELGGESRTLRTVKRLLEEDPGVRLRLVIGADVLADAARWHAFDRVAELAPPLVLGRVGHEGGGAPCVLPDVSSSGVRESLGRGARAEVASLVPGGVLDYIDQHGLYR